MSASPITPLAIAALRTAAVTPPTPLAPAATPVRQPFPGIGPGRVPKGPINDFTTRYGTSALYDALVAMQRMYDRNGS